MCDLPKVRHLSVRLYVVLEISHIDQDAEWYSLGPRTFAIWLASPHTFYFWFVLRVRPPVRRSPLPDHVPFAGHKVGLTGPYCWTITHSRHAQSNGRRAYSAPARLELMEHLETCLWQFELLGLPSKSTRCVDGEHHERVIVNVLICLDHYDSKNGTQPHLVAEVAVGPHGHWTNI